MKRISLILLLLCCTFYSDAQLLTTTPDFILETSNSIDIVADGTKGNAGIKDYANTTDIYVHIGCITSLSNSPLTAGKGYVFLPLNGDWSKKFGGTSATGGTILADGAVPSSNTPSPAVTGTYLIDVNFLTGKYTLTKQ
jgi:hypothetical protein